MICYPNAKINLGLNVVRKRPDGYHDLETVFYPIPLCDELEVMPSDQGDSGLSEDNLVIKALRLLEKDGYPIGPVSIRLEKNIPSGAGLGGGSADATFMLRALTELFHLQISTEKLEEYAARLGADCAIFVQNKPVFAEGIGNIFTPINLSLKGYYLVVIKPDIFISTKVAFSQIHPAVPKTSLLDIIQCPVEEWKTMMHNDFEDSVFPQFPEIETLKDRLYETGALYASMSGSGSSLYGIYRGPQELQDKFPGCFYICLPL